MSFQRDYILRIIEEIARFIAILLNLKQEKKLDVAYDMMTRQSRKMVGVSYEAYLKMSFEDFLATLKSKTLSSDYLDTLGQYFMVAGELCLSLEKDGEARHNLTFAKASYDEAEQRYSTYSFKRQVDYKKLKQLFVRVGMI